jgi:hypothetical protein
MHSFVHRGTLLGWLATHMSDVYIIFVLGFAAWVFDGRASSRRTPRLLSLS